MESTVRFVPVPACRGHRWIFSLAARYAGSAGWFRPKAEVRDAVGTLS